MSNTKAKTADFETTVDDRFLLSYKLPVKHDGFSLAPLDRVSSSEDKDVRVVGFGYSGGFLDRTIFSSFYALSVRRYREPVPDNLSATEFALATSREYARQRAVAEATQALFLPLSPEMKVEILGENWWVCHDLVRTGHEPKVWHFYCRRPIFEGRIVEISVRFSRDVERNSDDYRLARTRVLEIANSVLTRRQ